MLLLLFAIIVQGQTTTLPEAQEYTDGLFTNPINTDTPMLDVGAVINVTWTTTYEVVNLFLIFGTDYTDSFIATRTVTQDPKLSLHTDTWQSTPQKSSLSGL